MSLADNSVSLIKRANKVDGSILGAADLLYIHVDEADDASDHAVRFDVFTGALARLGGEYMVTDPRFNGGAVGDGTDEGAAINAILTAIESAGGTTAYFPFTPNGFGSSVTITIPLGLSIVMHPRARIVATSAIAGPLVRIDPSGEWALKSWEGGIIDANNLATKGFVVGRPAICSVRNVQVLDATTEPFVIGDASASANGFACYVRDVKVHRDKDIAVTASSIGFRNLRSTDCKVTDCEVVGYETGFKSDSTGGNRYARIHCWSYPQTAGVYSASGTGTMQVGFDDAGGNFYTDCYSDTPTVYGWRGRGFGTQFTNPKVYNGDFGGTNNVMVAFFFDQTGGPFSSVLNPYIHASGTAGHAILQDFQVASDSNNLLPNLTIWGKQTSGTITTSVRNHIPSCRITNLRIGGTTTASITNHLSATATFDFGSIAAHTTAELTMTLTGVAADNTWEIVAHPVGAPEAGLVWCSYASAANTVTIRMANITASPIDPASRVYRVSALQH